MQTVIHFYVCLYSPWKIFGCCYDATDSIKQSTSATTLESVFSFRCMFVVCVCVCSLVMKCLCNYKMLLTTLEASLFAGLLLIRLHHQLT